MFEIQFLGPPPKKNKKKNFYISFIYFYTHAGLN